MKPYEAPNTAARAGISGSTPTAVASGTTTGTTIPTLAVLLVVSEISTAMTVASRVIVSSWSAPRAAASPRTAGRGRGASSPPR
jgi:hypothetical protein